MKSFIAITSLVLVGAVTSLPAYTLPLKPQPVSEPKVDGTKFIKNSYEETFSVISFVERNKLISKACDDQFSTEIHNEQLSSWLADEIENYDAALDVKQRFETKLASLFGDGIEDTFVNRDRLTLKGVNIQLEKMMARDEIEVKRACQNWLDSISDKESFFYTKLGMGLAFFGQNHNKLIKMIDDNSNW